MAAIFISAASFQVSPPTNCAGRCPEHVNTHQPFTTFHAGTLAAGDSRACVFFFYTHKPKRV